MAGSFLDFGSLETGSGGSDGEDEKPRRAPMPRRSRKFPPPEMDPEMIPELRSLLVKYKPRSLTHAKAILKEAWDGIPRSEIPRKESAYINFVTKMNPKVAKKYRALKWTNKERMDHIASLWNKGITDISDEAEQSEGEAESDEGEAEQSEEDKDEAEQSEEEHGEDEEEIMVDGEVEEHGEVEEEILVEEELPVLPVLPFKTTKQEKHKKKEEKKHKKEKKERKKEKKERKKEKKEKKAKKEKSSESDSEPEQELSKKRKFEATKM